MNARVVAVLVLLLAVLGGGALYYQYQERTRLEVAGECREVAIVTGFADARRFVGQALGVGVLAFTEMPVNRGQEQVATHGARAGFVL